MNELKIFENKKFGKVRVDLRSNEPIFCLRDVCKILDIDQASKVKARLNEKGVTTIPTHTNGGTQNLIFINESNLYKVIFQSRKPEAEEFTEWVTSEVLPSIRKNGGYIAGQETLSDDDLLAKALIVAQNKIAEKQKQLDAQKEKVLFAEKVESSKTCILIGELAKLLNQKGIDIGQNRLFQWLRKNNYLCSNGNNYNEPTQRAMDMGLFEIKTNIVILPDKECKISRTSMVTGKGQIYFINKFLSIQED